MIIDQNQAPFLLSQSVRNALEANLVKEQFLKTEPYPYAVIPEFLDHVFFTRIRQSCQDLENFTQVEQFDVYHTHLNVLPLVSLFYSEFVRELIGKIFGYTVVRKKDQLPSLRRFPEASQGMVIHNDRDFEGHMTAFIYLSPWQAGQGGEVGIYKKQNNAFQLCDEVAPVPNSLLLMPINKISYHNVNAMSGGWVRRCAFFPLTIEE